jgi:hypothetical protein
VDVDIVHSTIARNRLGNTLVFGVAAIVVNFGCQRPAVVDMDYTIVEGHDHAGGDALHIWQGNALDLHQSLFAANTQNTNISGYPGGTPGTITGLATCLEAGSAGFVAPGLPEQDYHILSTSPAIDQALDSTTPEDIDGEGRPQDQASDIGADEAMLAPLVLDAIHLESGSLALSWWLAPSMLTHLDHYEIQVAVEAGASPPREGGLEAPIDMGQETALVLTGLTDGKEYVIQVVAYDPTDAAFAESTVTAIPMRVFRAFLPLALGR